jgi:hypothetical protein
VNPNTSVFFGQQDDRHGAIGFGDGPDSSSVPQFIGREHATALAGGAQSPKHAWVQVHIGFSPVAAKAFRALGVTMSRPSRKRGVPKGSGLGRAERDQGVSGFAYDADGLEVLGFGPGFTLLIGLAPPTPSAMAFRMSTSTTSFEPTTFTMTPSMALVPSRGVLASKLCLLLIGQIGLRRSPEVFVMEPTYA